jgi:hypothetical protein
MGLANSKVETTGKLEHDAENAIEGYGQTNRAEGCEAPD